MVRATIDELVRNGFRLRDRIRDNATKEVIRTTNAEAGRLVQRQCALRNKEGGSGIIRCVVVATGKLIVLDLGLAFAMAESVALSWVSIGVPKCEK